MKQDQTGRIVTCDFCDEPLEEDEELHPIYVGEIPSPKPIIAKAEKEKIKKNIAGYKLDEYGETKVLSKPIDEIDAIMEAIEGCKEIEIKTARRVMEPVPLEQEPDLKTTRDFGSSTNDSKVGATVTVRPEPPRVTPDMEVCKICKEEFER